MAIAETAPLLTIDGVPLKVRLARAERAYLAYRQSVAETIDASLDPSPLTLGDMPPALMRSYISDQGKLAMEIYPKLPEGDPRIKGPLSPHFLPGFVQALQEVVDRIENMGKRSCVRPMSTGDNGTPVVGTNTRLPLLFSSPSPIFYLLPA